jgi:signal transduction histidine kinase
MTTEPDGRSLTDVLVDAALAVAIVALGIASAQRDRADLMPLLIILAAPLLVRRTWPLAVLVVVAAIAVVTSRNVEGPLPQIAAVAIASYTAGELATNRTRQALAVLGVASLVALGFIAQESNPLTSLVVPFVVMVPTWLLGDVVRSRRIDEADRAAAVARRLAEAEARIRAAVAEERRHMARDLHDVVAHGVSVMLIQAGAARQVLDSSPERARESLLNVEAAGREAMAELRRMLGVLNDDGEAATTAPQPGVDQLPELIERVREAGLPAELSILGDRRPLPGSLDTTVYRIVQEALTNALRYAARARTLIELSFEPTQLRIEILDDGPSASAGPIEGTGRGLAGLEQRAAQVGGRLEAGPRLGGGFAVRAWLPLATGIRPEPA